MRFSEVAKIFVKSLHSNYSSYFLNASTIALLFLPANLSSNEFNIFYNVLFAEPKDSSTESIIEQAKKNENWSNRRICKLSTSWQAAIVWYSITPLLNGHEDRLNSVFSKLKIELFVPILSDESGELRTGRDWTQKRPFKYAMHLRLSQLEFECQARAVAFLGIHCTFFGIIVWILCKAGFVHWIATWLEETPGNWNKGISQDRLCVDNSKHASKS